MMKAIVRCGVVICCAFAVTSTSVFGEARMFVLPVGVDPYNAPPGTYTMVATGGQDVVFDIWLEETGTCDVRMHQVWFDCQATGGDVGQIVFVSDAIDNSRTDYIFYALATMPKVEHQGDCPTESPDTEGPRASQICTDVYPFITDPVYLSTWTFHVDADAEGTFTLRPWCPVVDNCQYDRTSIVCGDNTWPLFNVDPLEVELPVGQCCVGGLCVGDYSEWVCLNTYGGTSWDPEKSCATDPCSCEVDEDCDDGTFCNGEETCVDESCQDGSYPCTEPPLLLCDEENNVCVECFNDPDCDDGEFCNGSETCVDYACQPGVTEPEETPCGDPNDTFCDPADTCDGYGNCDDNMKDDGTPCDDGLFCNIGEECLSGVCQGGTYNECDDGIDCTSNICDEDANECVNDLYAGYCLIDGTCYGEGESNPENECQVCDTAQSTSAWTDKADDEPCTQDDDDCTDDVCLSGVCEHPCSPPDTPCDDGNPCTDDDVCGDYDCVCEGTPNPNCNETCQDAVQVFEGVTEATNTSAVLEDDDEAGCQPDANHDVWFYLEPICDGEVFMGTSAVAPVDFDSVLSVYSACGGTEVACDDDSGEAHDAALTFYAFSANTYYIRVAGFQEQVGSFELTISTVNDCLIGGVCYPDGALDPENDCMACIPEISTTEWSPRSLGSPCGNPRGECDNPDACDGNGVCEANHKPDGTPCSDDDNDCTSDVCETGLCVHPNMPVDVPCGDDADTECDNPDTCDGAGTCLDNYEPEGFGCGDDTDTDCDDPDSCDAAGTCLINWEPNGTSCTDEGNDCTDDLCNQGVCEHPFLPPGEPCGNQDDSQCDHPDTCNGIGACLDNWEPDTVDCDDEEFCTINDQCVSGVCVGTYHPLLFADVFPFPLGDGAVEGFDILCILDAANELNSYGCLTILQGRIWGDIWPCDTGDGAVEGFDILAVLDAANGINWCPDPCPSLGACCVEGECTDDVLEADCPGDWFREELCSEVICP